ncbi:hypothetical protein [Listeria booriae]|uniref:hypothetical protein n=1 Tax=Listeria booriae TaxID=1552123 RepID=UPI0016295D25|nr:hypothetical protein [Listeria booriae]MBC2069289.1 hypothetical protein [Listeria booriae]
MKMKYLVLAGIVAFSLILSACGSFSMEGVWDGRDQDGNAAILTFKEDSVLVDIGFKTAYTYTLNKDQSIITFQKEGKNESYKLKRKDDNNIILYNQDKEETLSLERE